MLPFLKRTKEASMSAPLESIERKPDEEHEHEYDIHESLGEDLCKAIKAEDYKAIGEVLKAAFELFHSEEHEEEEHV